jgi:quercetin dioxygenase-like cupin family protein
MPVENSIVSQLLSRSSHGGDIVVGEFDLPAGHWFNWHDHDEHQLAWAASGVLSVTTAEAVWVLPPTRALWIPAGTRHTTGASTTATVRTLYVRAGGRFAEPTAVAVDDVLAALIGYLARDELSADARARAEAVVHDVITPAPAGAIRVPMPRDDRATDLARRLSADPADDRDLPAWGTGGRRERADTGPAVRRRDGAQLRPVAHPGAHAGGADPPRRGYAGRRRGPPGRLPYAERVRRGVPADAGGTPREFLRRA